MLRQVVVMKWGPKYGPEYVNRMYGMVARNITGPFSFVCLTDDGAGLRKEVAAHPLPQLGCEPPMRARGRRTLGKWNKLAIWGRDVEGLRPGPALFIDLDSVIVGSIDPYFEIGGPDDVFLARNWVRPLRRYGQTSVFRFPVGGHPEVLERFRADPQAAADRCEFEQHFVTESVAGGIKFWPRAWTRHFRLHCLPVFPLRLFLPARIPGGARIITFPGFPDPRDAADGRWFPAHAEHPGLATHVLDTFRPSRRSERKAWRHLTRYVLPVDWIRSHWRE